jgi:uncharacterized protein YkwD
VARGVCTVVSIVVFALLASSAAAVTTEGKAPLPSKQELRIAGNALAGKGRASLDRRPLRRLGPAVRSLALAKRVNTSTRAKTSRRSSLALSALESSLLARVNSVRRSRGLRGLTLSRGLTAAAAYHSRQMVMHGFFEHESRGGGSFWKRVERFYGSGGFRSWEVGENLAYGSPDLGAAATVRMWMNSPGHRDNLLSRRWREIGLGALHVASAGGEFGGSPVTVVTADFGIRVR